MRISQTASAECRAGGLVLTDYRPYAFLPALLPLKQKSTVVTELTGNDDHPIKPITFRLARNQMRPIKIDGTFGKSLCYSCSVLSLACSSLQCAPGEPGSRSHMKPQEPFGERINHRHILKHNLISWFV